MHPHKLKQYVLTVASEALIGNPTIMANNETYSDKQREEVRARLQRFQDEQKAINDQICILKGRYSNKIYQIRESIMKFLDKEMGTLGERIRTFLRNRV